MYIANYKIVSAVLRYELISYNIVCHDLFNINCERDVSSHL